MSLLWTCRDVIPLLTEYEEGTLSWYRRMRLRLHLLICPECKLLHEELKEIPPLVDELTQPASPELKLLAESALRGALARIGQAPTVRPAAGPVPEDVQKLIGEDRDLTLRLLESAHLALAQGKGSEAAPYLPPHILAELPHPERWTWHRRGTARVATLVDGAPGQPRLSLLVAPKGFQTPRHTHEGSETMLILDGVMEDGDKVFGTGAWLHFENGSTHAPVILNDECWCLIREVGGARIHGPFGWFQRLFAH